MPEYLVSIVTEVEYDYSVDANDVIEAKDKGRARFAEEHPKLVEDRITITRDNVVVASGGAVRVDLCPGCLQELESDKVCMNKKCQIYGGE